ncbi:MAG: hypothetical protein HYY06_17530 [Deltaproteobacteria bacterium]|nr:hypothetical protein [Deltaproteobacteria bacterium]
MRRALLGALALALASPGAASPDPTARPRPLHDADPSAERYAFELASGRLIVEGGGSLLTVSFEPREGAATRLVARPLGTVRPRSSVSSCLAWDATGDGIEDAVCRLETAGCDPREAGGSCRTERSLAVLDPAGPRWTESPYSRVVRSEGSNETVSCPVLPPLPWRAPWTLACLAISATRPADRATSGLELRYERSASPLTLAETSCDPVDPPPDGDEPTAARTALGVRRVDHRTVAFEWRGRWEVAVGRWFVSTEVAPPPGGVPWRGLPPDRLDLARLEVGDANGDGSPDAVAIGRLALEEEARTSSRQRLEESVIVVDLARERSFAAPIRREEVVTVGTEASERWQTERAWSICEPVPPLPWRGPWSIRCWQGRDVNASAPLSPGARSTSRGSVEGRVLSFDPGAGFSWSVRPFCRYTHTAVDEHA